MNRARTAAAALFRRVFLINGLIFVLGTLILAVSPATVSARIKLTEIPVLVVGLAIMLTANAVLLRRSLAPMLKWERTTASASALAAQENERQRIARELHDEIGQTLTVALLILKRAVDRAPDEIRDAKCAASLDGSGPTHSRTSEHIELQSDRLPHDVSSCVIASRRRALRTSCGMPTQARSGWTCTPRASGSPCGSPTTARVVSSRSAGGGTDAGTTGADPARRRPRPCAQWSADDPGRRTGPAGGCRGRRRARGGCRPRRGTGRPRHPRYRDAEDDRSAGGAGDQPGTPARAEVGGRPRLLDEVLKLVAEGYSSREIANTLGISAKTVDRHRTNTLAKLGLRDRLALTRYAIRAGLIEP